MKNWNKLITVIAVLAIISLAACNPFAAKSQSNVQTVKVTRGDLTASVSGSGNVEVSDESKLTFSITGRISKISVKEGDHVKKGDPIAKLETSTLELSVAQAKIAVTQAEVAVTQADAGVQSANLTVQKLLDTYTWPQINELQTQVDNARAFAQYALDNLATAPSDQKVQWQSTLRLAQGQLAFFESELDAIKHIGDTKEVAIARTQLAAAQQSLDLAKANVTLTKQSQTEAQKTLDKAAISAPFDGVIASIPVHEGDTITPAVMIADLVDPTRLKLKVQVDELDIPQVQTGQTADIKADALPNLKLQGKVTLISPLSSQKSGVTVYDVTVTFNVDEATGLRDGMSVTADIIVAQSKNVLLVPTISVVVEANGNSYVQQMVNGKPEKKNVVTGVSDGIQTEIVSGLNEGDEIVQRPATSTSTPGLF